MRTDDVKFQADQFERLYRLHPEMEEFRGCRDGRDGTGEQPRRSCSTLLLGMLASTIAFTACQFFNPIMQSSASSIVTPAGLIQYYQSTFVADRGTESYAEQVHARLQEGTVNVSKSTVTGIVDAATMTSSLYWTVILKNNNFVDKEASFVVDLPKNATVSRATLWVNGVAQEAAFSSNQQVKAAYDRIVVRHRDPLLVTQIAPNRIKVLASPVPANGGEMKLRLGFTAPLRSDDNGHNTVTLPKVAESNLKFDCRHDVHLQSATPLSGLGSTEEAGIYTLKANVDTSAVERAEIKVGEPGSREFAARLTHTSPSQYVVGKFEDGRLVLRKEENRPSCKFFSSDDVAFRLSNLWAHQEIERTALSGDTAKACDLANTYRVLSSVSGATVLETDDDYSASSLNRDMYRVIGSGDSLVEGHNTNTSSFTGAQSLQGGSSAPQLQGATNGTIGAQGSDAFDNGAPVLQGATVGGIGPQGSDATVIQGVNTAGYIRVNNLANLEAVLNLLSGFGQFVGMSLALLLGFEAANRRRGFGKLSKRSAMILSAVLCLVAFYIPSIVNLVVVTARDLNLFS